MKAGDRIKLHDLAHMHIDAFFKTVGGWAIYEGISYPDNASGWWAIVSRFTEKGIVTRRMHTDTIVEIVEIKN